MLSRHLGEPRLPHTINAAQSLPAGHRLSHISTTLAAYKKEPKGAPELHNYHPKPTALASSPAPAPPPRAISATAALSRCPASSPHLRPR